MLVTKPKGYRATLQQNPSMFVGYMVALQRKSPCKSAGYKVAIAQDPVVFQPFASWQAG